MNRVEKLLAALGLRSGEAVLLHNPSNMFYISGYTGEGMVAAGADFRAVVTDFRYTEQAEHEAPDFEVRMTDKGLSHHQVLAGLFRQHGVTAVRYEDGFVTVSEFAQMQSAMPDVTFSSACGKAEEIRQFKDADEVARIEEACRITGEAFERLLPQIREGMTERELALKLEFDMFSRGAEGLAFKTIVAAGANGSLPHAHPGDRPIRSGQMITFDFGAKVRGYCADMTRTVAFGKPSEEMRRVYQVVYDAQRMAQDALAPDKKCSDIDAIARDYIYAHGYEGRFGHGLGHAVGIDIHEDPRLSQTCHAITHVGHVLTVEPGVYLPGIGGVRIENSCLVTEDGCRSLTHPTRELIIL